MKFLAILKDSFREAVDGWIIFAMFALSTLLIVFIASFSVEPLPADKAFEHITQSFIIVYPDQGKGIFARPFPFGVRIDQLKKLTDASAPQAADYSMVLRIMDFGAPIRSTPANPPAEGDNKQADGKKDSKVLRLRSNSFRQAVAYWSRPAEKEEALGRKEVDGSDVTDEMMVNFIKGQFHAHINMELQKVAKLPDDSDGSERFEIETKGTKDRRGWPHYPHLLFGLWKINLPFTLGSQLYLIESTILSDIGATIALLVSVVITAFFIPNLMRKGSIDLLLSKPMSRPLLLVYKYIGGLTFMLLNTAFAVLGVWLMIGLRTGVWGTGLLWTIFAVTYYFALLYAVSTLVAVLTRNAIVAILVTTFFWGVMFVFGFAHNKLEPLRDDKTLDIPHTVFVVSDVVNATLPRTTDLDNLMNKWVVDDTLSESEKKAMRKDKFVYPSWIEVFGVSGIYIFLMLGLACWRFSTRDY
jgi:ABC-type transport system involved in multi-copper enzyme maturation permease subunit